MISGSLCEVAVPALSKTPVVNLPVHWCVGAVYVGLGVNVNYVALAI